MEETPHEDIVEEDTDQVETEEASKEAVDATSASYAKLITPSGFMAPTSSYSSQQQSNADDSDDAKSEGESEPDPEPVAEPKSEHESDLTILI